MLMSRSFWEYGRFDSSGVLFFSIETILIIRLFW